jgi:hypothetical protein
MTRQFHIFVIGVILLIIGSLIRYLVGKSRFNRRNHFGLQRYRSYEEGVVTRAGQGCAGTIGTLFVLAGLLLLFAGLA